MRHVCRLNSKIPTPRVLDVGVGNVQVIRHVAIVMIGHWNWEICNKGRSYAERKRPPSRHSGNTAVPSAITPCSQASKLAAYGTGAPPGRC